MTQEVSRRQFLNTSFGALVGSVVLADRGFADAACLFQQSEPPPAAPSTTLRAMKRTLEINGKAADVMGLLQPNGIQGMSAMVNSPFQVTLDNQLPVPTAIHWHGLHPPNNEDGVPGVTQPVIRAGASTFYNFPLQPAGTHWMHSHQGLQEAFLLAAPLIVHDPADRARDQQEIVVLLSDYSFTPPKEIYARLRQGQRGMAATAQPLTSPAMPNMKAPGAKPDANDVNYDAYLANDRTLLDPEVVQVEKGGQVRLRIINGSSGTNFFIDLGSLSGEVIATDGMPVQAVRGSRFPLAIAQRMDIVLRVPPEGGAFPILALRELATEQTGIVLATSGAKVSRLPVTRSSASGLLTLDLERKLTAVTPLKAKPPDQTSVLRLQGNMSRYQWLINDVAFNVADPANEKAQVHVKSGQRVVLKFVNQTPMSHPMHLHGHSFQVIAINDVLFTGALRDTVLVPALSSVTVQFDANNPGLWYVHCHVLWHLDAGMAALVQYEA
jgi:FtsP/CotA-like multicopper oxidase with cupredoxin domain